MSRYRRFRQFYCGYNIFAQYRTRMGEAAIRISDWIVRRFGHSRTIQQPSSGYYVAPKLNQPQRPETRMTISSNDDVVVQTDTKRAGGISDLLGHVDVGARRCWITRRVIVNEDDRGRG